MLAEGILVGSILAKSKNICRYPMLYFGYFGKLPKKHMWWSLILIKGRLTISFLPLLIVNQ